MVACGSLQHIFENPSPENPTLIESLSPWNQIKPVKPVDQPSFIEMFGELHFKESSQSSSSSSTWSSSSSFFPMSSISSSSSPLLDVNIQNNDGLDVNNNDTKKSTSLDLFASGPMVMSLGCHARSDSFSSINSEPSGQSFKYTSGHNKSDSFSSMNSESLQLCTEGLGFESSDDVEDLKNEMNEDWQNQQEKVSITKHSPTENSLAGEFRRTRSCSGAFPPPISCIGKSGKPWVCFKSYRHNGRFVLKEIRMPSQEFLHACREEGRLKLQFVHPNDDIRELEDEDSEEDELEAVEVDKDEQNENGSVHNAGEEKREANTRSYEAEN